MEKKKDFLKTPDANPCFDCAQKRGWRWPSGHVATCSMGRCDDCGAIRALAGNNDWLKPGEMKLKVWD